MVARIDRLAMPAILLLEASDLGADSLFRLARYELRGRAIDETANFAGPPAIQPSAHRAEAVGLYAGSATRKTYRILPCSGQIPQNPPADAAPNVLTFHRLERLACFQSTRRSTSMEDGNTNTDRHAPVTLTISGMVCDGCAITVKRILSRVAGVSQVEVDFPDGRAVVTGPASAPSLIEAVKAAGYDARLP